MTALEKKWKAAEDANPNHIPDMDHPLGKNWNQPSRDKILIDDQYALMEKFTFDQLADYSFSQPTGVYPGKMWKSGRHKKWFLCWFGYSSKGENFCSNNYREIVIV